ncbi:unnamed protein product [Caenorhabditis angaria]|uniref:long-chain-fatty-acid--CoA ligase n=1 Tax=Caenorhabditis angaria TaxID=860376 RepID=A0A9P1N248_9PELO|nr:unnamed protein product [Caenorhabditis angaria]
MLSKCLHIPYSSKTYQLFNYSRRHVFSFLPKNLPPRDLKNQTIILPDGSRKAAWLKDKDLVKSFAPNIHTTYDTVRYGLKLAGDKGKMFGEPLRNKNGEVEWKWIDYSEGIKQADRISQSMRKIGLKAGEDTKIGIFSKNRTEWMLADMANHNFSNVTVPFYDTITVDDMVYISNLTEIPLIFTDSEDKTKLLIETKPRLTTLETIVQFDPISKSTRELATSQNIKIYDFDEFVNLSRLQDPIPHVPPKSDSLASISFTSGTTGRPKGVMLTHMNLCSVSSILTEFEYDKGIGERFLSYLPLAHIYERCCNTSALMTGGKIGFYRGSPEHILEHARSLRVNTFATVPRVNDKIHKGIMRSLVNQPIKRNILRAAIGYKLLHYKITGTATRDTWVDRKILKKIQDLLGPDLKQITVGAAKSEDRTLLFMRGAFGCHVFEGYGQTETSGPIVVQIRGDVSVGNVGVPLPCSTIKLRDVPDLDYYVDKNGGEILVKGYNVTKGYYKNEKATKEAFTEDGFMKTGDIGRWTSNGTLEIIDRMKNVFKLPQGKFVAPEGVESLYISSRFVNQVYVHGDVQKPWLVAIVSPDVAQLTAYAESRFNITGKSIEELCKEPELINAIQRKLMLITKTHDRPKYEGVYAVHLTPVQFTSENGLTTPTLKNKRHSLAKWFEKEINDMFHQIEQDEAKKYYE